MFRIPTNGIEEKNPSFFKIILPGLSTEHVRIPPRFVREHIANQLPKRATLKLKRSSEYSWNVKVEKSGEDVYLKDGWLEFMRDACLGDKEFLVFIYTRKMHFSIKIFDKNGCERMVFPDINTHQNTISSRSTKRHRGRPIKYSISNSADVLFKEEEEDYMKYTEKSTSKSTEMPTSESSKRSPVLQKETTSERTKRPRGRPRKYTVTGKFSAAGKHIPKSELDVLEAKEEEEECQESGDLLISKSYFTSKIHRLSQVYVCKQFYVENLSSRNYNFVFLKNSEGTEWYKVTLSHYRGTAFMTKGWHAFADANQVKVGGLCQFQFLKENKIVVHILTEAVNQM